MMPSWTPTPEQVHGLIPQRVTGGPFTTTTTPTVAQVSSLADGVSEEVLAEVGGTVPAELEGQANWAARLGTAAYVESALFPEQSDDGLGAQLYERYRETLTRLRNAVEALGTAGVPGDVTMSTTRTRSAVVVDYEAGLL
jgi:hypothetical protein